MHSISKISYRPDQHKKANTGKDPDDFLLRYYKHPVNPISHSHPKQNICLIGKFEHGVGSRITILINIPYINNFRNKDQSNRTKSHDHSKQIRNRNCLQKSVQALVLHSFQFFCKNRDDQKHSKKHRKSPENQKLVPQRMMLCKSHSLNHGFKFQSKR